MMHELIGNGAEAEALLRTGKEISNFHGLSVFCVVFTSSLGIYNSISMVYQFFLYCFSSLLGIHNSLIVFLFY
jgi:hypothetical protein